MCKRIGLLVCLILLVSTLGCSLFGYKTQDNSRLLNDKVLFIDDFSNPKSGWVQYKDNSGSLIAYVADGLRILINKPQTDLWTTPGISMSDVWIETDATLLAGPDDNLFGIICRYQDNQSFYAFLISSDGYFGVVKFIEGKNIMMGGSNMQYASIIKQGRNTNHIRAVCKGNVLTLGVNGMDLIQVQDDLYKDGGMGLIAGTYQHSGVDMFFDNFYVLRP
jgi:hypothetical protein